MPKITVDGKEIQFTEKKKLLPFLLETDNEVPYFCWHPEMSIPTNCRMCLVEVGYQMKDKDTKELLVNEDGSQKIQWGFKPVTSCNNDLVDGMFVKTNRTSPIIDKAQKGVLEFMLINHPLDCPICDQAGECPLQINTYKYGPEGSRFEVSKVHKPKRIELGPRVTLDAERCINCTRCVRFTEEISKSDQLSIVARGDKNFPATAPGKVFDEPYSMNVIDICPVGALTSDDFRFKARAWEMNFTPGICVHDSMGTNIDVWVRDNLVMRLTPRYNENINKYWIADENRLAYQKYNENRVSGIKVQGDIPVDFEQGLQYAAQLLNQHKNKILFIASAHASVESLFALTTLAKQYNSPQPYYVPHSVENRADNFLLTNDLTPNSAGCQLLGLNKTTTQDLIQLIQNQGTQLVYLMEDDAVAAELVAQLSGKVKFIIHSTNYFQNHDQVTVLIPATTSIEAPGTYINSKNIPQVTMQAKQIKQMTPEMWMAMPKSRLDSAAVAMDNWRNQQNIVDCLPSWMLISKIAAYANQNLNFNSHKEIFTKIKTQYESLKDLKLLKKNRKESFKISQLEFAIN